MRKSGPDHALYGDKAVSVLWEASVRWIAWGLRPVNGEQEPYILGELDCESHILAALVHARRRYGCLAVNHVQSRSSHEIDLLETHHGLIYRKRHPRPYTRKRQQPLVPAK